MKSSMKLVVTLGLVAMSGITLAAWHPEGGVTKAQQIIKGQKSQSTQLQSVAKQSVSTIKSRKNQLLGQVQKADQNANKAIQAQKYVAQQANAKANAAKRQLNKTAQKYRFGK